MALVRTLPQLRRWTMNNRQPRRSNGKSLRATRGVGGGDASDVLVPVPPSLISSAYMCLLVGQLLRGLWRTRASVLVPVPR